MQNTEMQRNLPTINKILVVLSPDLVLPTEPDASPLLIRAMELAKRFGAGLEIFHVCYDASLDWGKLAAVDAVQKAREDTLQRDATLISEMVARLPSAGTEVTFDVQWGTPRHEVILQKAERSGADLILKQAREHSYVIGLMHTVDWALIRGTHVPVWFVKDQPSEADPLQPVNRVVSAVGVNASEESLFNSIDHDVTRLGQHVADKCNAEHVLVYNYLAPSGVPSFDGYAPVLNDKGVEISEQRGWRSQAVEHGREIQAFAEFHDLLDSIELEEGPAKTAIPRACQAQQADLLLMGVRDRSAWARLWQSAAAEPTLAEASCDVMFVKERERADRHSSVPVQTGAPAFDVERAIVAPQQVFNKPQDVVEEKYVSAALKRKILQSWQYDLRVLMEDENQGGVQQEDAVEPDQIVHALEALKRQSEANPPSTEKLSA